MSRRRSARDVDAVDVVPSRRDLDLQADREVAARLRADRRRIGDLLAEESPCAYCCGPSYSDPPGAGHDRGCPTDVARRWWRR